LPISYLSEDYPDYAAIKFSTGINMSSGTPGTKFWVDEVSFSGGTLSDSIESEGNQLSVFPNPARNNFRLDISDVINIESVSLHDVSGKEVRMWNGVTDNRYVIDDLPDGVYMVQVNVNGGVLSKRLVKF
jgi:hypothetical protein